MTRNIVIVISKLLKRYSKAKRTRAPAYSRALRRIKGGFQRGVKRSSGPISRVQGGGDHRGKITGENHRESSPASATHVLKGRRNRCTVYGERRYRNRI